jgi:phenylacetate-CoA ligase
MNSHLNFNRPKLACNWDQLSRSESLNLQDGLIKKFVREQLIFSPFYKKSLAEHGVDMKRFKGFEDWDKIPFCSKVDIVASEDQPAKPKDLILQPKPEDIKKYSNWSKKLGLLLGSLTEGREAIRRELSLEYRPVTLTFTTGRSSAPTPFFYSLYDMDLSAQIGERLCSVIGGSSEDLSVNLFPFAPHLAFWQSFQVSMGAGMFMLNTGGGASMGTAKIMALIDKMKPTLLMGIPGYFYHLLRMAEAEGFKFSSVKTVCLGGEKVSPLLKKRVREIFARMGAENVIVLSIMGFTESRQCWGECPSVEGSGFHIYPDTSYLEIIDPESGKVLEEGQTGELVYSTRDGRGSCLLRYRTGDVIEGGLVSGVCPHCGRSTTRMGTDVRRVSNKKDFNLSKVKGTLVDMNIITQLLANMEGFEEWQVELSKVDDDPLGMDQMVVYLALEAGANEAEIKEKVNKEMSFQCEIKPSRIEIESLEALIKRLGMEEKMKEDRIVDLR